MVDSILQKGAALVAALTTRSCGQAVNFRRGDTVTPEIAAVVGSKLFRYNDADGMDVVSRTRDFIFDVAELLAIDVTEPRRGDVIEMIDDAETTIKYDVAAPNGEPLFSYVDTDETRIRVHTFRADSVPIEV
jgi:hypothetical protein